MVKLITGRSITVNDRDGDWVPLVPLETRYSTGKSSGSNGTSYSLPRVVVPMFKEVDSVV